MEISLEEKVFPIYDCDTILSESDILSDNVSPLLEKPSKTPVSAEKYFPCAHCTTVHIFKSRSGLLRHEKKCHPEVPRRWKKKRTGTAEELEYKTVKNVICREDDCGFRCYKIGQLRRHLQTQHNFTIAPPETLQFDSMEEFETWKKNHELATQSKFVRRWTRADGAHEYLCNRSGSYRSQSKGFRQPRIAGSLKSGGHCTARIILFNGKSKLDLKNGVQITFYPTHYGHSIYTSMNKRKIMQENKRKQRILATASATELKGTNYQPVKPKLVTSAVSSVTGTSSKRRKSASTQSNQDFQNVIQEIESNLLTIKTMQTKSLAEDSSKSNFKLIFTNSGLSSENVVEADPLSLSPRAEEDDSNYKSDQQPGHAFDLIKLENSWETSSQIDEIIGSEHILKESDIFYGKRKQTEEIHLESNNNCVNSESMESHLGALNAEMDRLYSLKPYLNKITTADDSTRILTLVNFVHDSIVEVLASGI